MPRTPMTRERHGVCIAAYRQAAAIRALIKIKVPFTNRCEVDVEGLFRARETGGIDGRTTLPMPIYGPNGADLVCGRWVRQRRLP
jgi:hypothetical protein